MKVTSILPAELIRPQPVVLVVARLKASQLQSRPVRTIADAACLQHDQIPQRFKNDPTATHNYDVSASSYNPLQLGLRQLWGAQKLSRIRLCRGCENAGFADSPGVVL